jgi:type I restriction enzyme M protein
MDPACGAGGFLSAAARYKLRKGTNPADIANTLFGIEKDSLLAHLAESHIALTTLGEANIVCADALSSLDEDGNQIDPNFCAQFDIVLSNPPFGAKIVSASDDVRRKYELGYRWKKNKNTGVHEKLSTFPKNVPPQILFVEKIISLIKDGGRLGIVLPESLVSNNTYSHVVQYIREKMTISAVVGMPEALFKSSGKGGTHTKVCLVVAEKRAPTAEDQVYMAEAKWCGHDSRGRTIPNDDLPGMLSEYLAFKRDRQTPKSGYSLRTNQISSNILCPRYYEPAAKNELLKLSETHDLLVVGDLIERGILSLSTGDEPGKLAYGTGDIPFVRTSDISNWEIKFDPKHCVSDEIYSKYKLRQDVQEGDVLFVRDGTYLIGSCGYVSKYDEKIVYQSHLYKIRSNDWNFISPFLLLAAFSCAPVIAQIQSKRFTQDIIDTIGSRINELVLPIPKDRQSRMRIESLVKKAIEDRIEARELTRQAKLDICHAN